MIENPKRVLGIRLVGLARRWRQYLDTQLSSSGLSDATWAPLMHLHRAGEGLLQRDLAARVGLDVSSLVRLLDILEARELVERQPDPHDRRAKRLFLTPAGHAQVARIRNLIEPLEDELLQDLDDAATEALLQAFERIEARLAAANTREDGA
ncbi:MarR family transcriptional regulator [Rhizobium sp. CRIBSB]|nr:MarR family transcriptional regulator [Rhizobium sp. CRIBSB]